MAASRAFRIYISSTVDDLKDERGVAERIAARHGEVRLTRRADSAPVVEACLRDVRESDVYVCIVGMRYGWQPDATLNPEGKSITELEYDACGDRIPRLVFVKDGPIRPKPPFQDDDTTRIRAFRARVQAGVQHTAYPFDDDDADKEKGFALKLDQALTAEKARFLQKWGEMGGALGGAGRPREDLLRAVALVGLEGDDDALISLARSAGETGVRCSTLRLDEVDWWTELDRRFRRAQSPSLLLSATGLQRLAAEPARTRIATLLKAARAAVRPVTLALAGVDAQALPAAWADGLPVALGAPPTSAPAARTMLEALVRAIDASSPALPPGGDAASDSLHHAWHALASRRSAADKVALPVVIVAPTASEMSSLAGPKRAGFSGYEKALRRRQRIEDFRRLQPERRLREAGWPANTYGDDRTLWRCFGPGFPPALALVLAALKAINEAQVGSRERRLLPQLRVVPRLYRFEDLLEGATAGPGKALLDATAAGALVVVDEFALLHPGLREAAEPLLDQPRTAAVSVCLSDPTQTPSAELLDEDSFLRVGQFLRRYKTERDPRCEVAVNSLHRLERWVRLVVPEMLALGDAGEALPALASRVPELLSPTSGLT